MEKIDKNAIRNKLESCMSGYKLKKKAMWLKVYLFRWVKLKDSIYEDLSYDPQHLARYELNEVDDNCNLVQKIITDHKIYQIPKFRDPFGKPLGFDYHKDGVDFYLWGFSAKNKRSPDEALISWAWEYHKGKILEDLCNGVVNVLQSRKKSQDKQEEAKEWADIQVGRLMTEFHKRYPGVDLDMRLSIKREENWEHG